MSRDVEARDDNLRKLIDRRTWLTGLGVAGATALAGCSSGGGEDTDTPGGGNNSTESTNTDNPYGDTQTPGTESNELPEVSGTYRQAVSSELTTLNPLYNSENGAGAAIGWTLEMGYGFKPGTERFPQLYELSSDSGQVWVAKLRENLQFGGDYGNVTAEDFEYQINEVQIPEWATTADSTNWTSEINVEANSEYEFQIELPEPQVLYPLTYDPLLYPIPKALMEKYAPDEDTKGLEQDEELNNLTFTGNLGPYKLDNWDKGAKLSYVRNEEYYLREADDLPNRFGNAPYFENLSIRVVPEESARIGALKNGEIDSVSLPPNRVNEFKENSDTYVSVTPQPYNRVMVYNMRDNGWNAGPGNLFRKKKFRQGLGCAVNKQNIADGVFNGYAKPHYTWQPEWSTWYPEDGVDKYGTGDLYGKEVTQSRIEEAISDTDYSYDGDMLMNPDGNQVEISLYYSAGQPVKKSMSEYIAQEYENNAGIVVNAQAIQNNEYVTNYWQQQVPEDPSEYEWSKGVNNAGPREVTSSKPWDMAIVYGFNTYPLNPASASAFFAKDAAFNAYGYYPDWDANGLFQQATNASSREEAQEAFTEIFKNVAEGQPMAMLVFDDDTIGYREGIEGPIENFWSGWDSSTWHRSE